MHRPGLYTALITPFAKDGTIAFTTFAHLVKRQLDAGVQGIVVMGTTGESATISPDERSELIKHAKKASLGKIFVMAGCGTSDTATSIKQAQAAEKSGADALQIPAPAYNKPSQEGLLRHFKAIHDAVNIPMFIYNVPGRVAVNISPQTLAQLIQLERCIGAKEASGNVVHAMELLDLTKSSQKPITLLSGDDLLALPLISIGAHGVMSVISNLFPQTMNQLVTAALEGNLENARQLHYRLRPLMQACFIESNPVPIKFMMEHAGLASEQCRLPLAPLAENNKKELSTLLEQYTYET